MANLFLKQVSKSYPGNVQALDGFDLEIADGEFVVVVGPSGCGKTTLLRLVAGLEEVTSGEIVLNNQVINEFPPRKRNIAMMFQNYVLFPHMTVRENMAFGLKLRKTEKSVIQKRVKEVAETLGIQGLLQRYPHALSGGQRQRAALGRAVLRSPDVFLLDEPLSNLDAKMRAQMRVEIRQVQKKLNATMVFVTHDQAEAMTMGDRIVVLKDGVIQQVADPLTLYEHPANRFVAGFVGTPGMNFFTGEIAEDNGAIRFKHSSFSLPVARESRARLLPFAGKEVVLGLRPEDVLASPENGDKAADKPLIVARVKVVEHMGSHAYVYLQTGEDTCIARAEPQHKFNPGQELGLSVQVSKSHFFDAETGRAV
ncbi:ABC transporter ATP-binding protein [Fibrobacterota bacterium]